MLSINNFFYSRCFLGHKKIRHLIRGALFTMVRLAGFEPAHPVPETGALSPEL